MGLWIRWYGFMGVWFRLCGSMRVWFHESVVQVVWFNECGSGGVVPWVCGSDGVVPGRIDSNDLLFHQLPLQTEYCNSEIRRSPYLGNTSFGMPRAYEYVNPDM